MDYYKVLGVGRDASIEKIKTAYKELARRWHPDKNMNDDEMACAEKFKKISEAYEALKDERESSSVRAIPSSRFPSSPSSLFGRGSSRTYPDSSMDSVLHSIFKSTAKETPEVSKHSQKNAKYNFHKNQRSNGRGPSPYGSFTDPLSTSRSGQEAAVKAMPIECSINCTLEELYAGSIKLKRDVIGLGPSPYGFFTDPLSTSLSGQEATVKAKPIECSINCTLEELYAGTIKRIGLKRDVLDRRGKPMQMDETLTINIRPGSEKGTKFIFEEKGNEKLNTIPADIIVNLNQKPHDLITREGDDLILNETISFFDVLTCSCSVDFRTLDGRHLTVPINCMSFPFHEKVVKREGMPRTNDPSKRGDLRIRLNVRLF